MKKFIQLILILFTSCALKEDYYQLSIDDYLVTVGYDDGEYMRIAYDFNIKDELEANEVIKDVNIFLNGKLLGVGEFTNRKNKAISSDKAKLTKLTVYLNDLDGRTFKLNGEPLDSSIKTTCDKYNGTYIEKNGYACVIQTEISKQLNVVELYGDYLNLNQDEIDHIVIYVDE